jgi:hypothetical protein
MKKFLTIPVALLIFLSGMHVTFATHFCGGKIAATKISVTGKVASCGMDSDEKSKSASETSLTSKCCENTTAVYSVDDNYAPSALHDIALTQNILFEYVVPGIFISPSDLPMSANSTNVSPPGCYKTNAVSIADICVFRI